MHNRILIVLILILYTGCTVQETNINHPHLKSKSFYTIKYAKDIIYNKQINQLKILGLTEKRPIAGNFKLLYFEKELLIMSFDINIKDENKFEPLNPLKTLVTHTGDGLKLGLDIISNTHASNTDAMKVLISIPIVTTIGGFVLGLVVSIPSIALELKDLIIINEVEILNYQTIYMYDKNNFLTHTFKG